MVGELIRLKVTIQRHNAGWKRRTGLAFGVLAAAGTWLLVLLFAGPTGRTDVLLLALAAWLVGWLVGPMLTSGAAVLRPEYFTLLPLSRVRLGIGLLVAVFVGVGPAVTAVAVLVISGYAAAAAAGAGAAVVIGAVVAGIVGAVLLLIFLVALARTCYALAGAAMRTRMGVEIAAIQYGLLIATMFAGWMVVAPVVGAVPGFLHAGFAGGPATAVLGWLPTGWPVRAIDAIVTGAVPAALAWLGGLALLTALAVGAAIALLTPYVGNRTSRRRKRPLGSRVLAGPSVLPAGPLGAVVGKELRTWWRDPWRSLEVRSSIWFGLFLAVYALIAGRPEVAGLAGAAVASMVALSGANLLGHDGTALWLLVVGQSRRAVRADIRGRQLGLVLVWGVPAVVLSALLMVLTGEYAYAIPIAAVIVAGLGVGSGIAVLVSVIGVTPGVDPHRRVNASDAGENLLSLQIAFVAVLVCMAPTTTTALLLAFLPATPAWFGAATLAVAIGNAAVVAWLAGAAAARRLENHLPETFARLRYAGTAAASAGTGLLDRLARKTESQALAARQEQ